MTIPTVAVRSALGADDERDRPAPLARFFPREHLVVYAEFDGLDAHRDPWRQTAAYRLLNETTTGEMLEQMVARVADRVLSSAPGPQLSGKEFLTILEGAARSGFAFGIVRAPDEPRPSCIGLVVRGAARGPVREALGKLIGPQAGQGMKTREDIKRGGRRVTVVGDPRSQAFAWWHEGEDLVVSISSPQGADLMIECLDGTRPDATGNPLRAALTRSEAGFTPVGLAFFARAALPPLPQQATALGLDGIARIDFRWGFQGEALMSVTRLVAPAPRSGVLALLDQPTFDRRGLPPLPAGLAGFTAFSIAPDAFYSQLTALAGVVDPKGEAAFRNFEQSVQRVTGKRFREDILSHLGPKWAFYVVPARINAPTNVLGGIVQGLAHIPQASLVIDVKDPAAFAEVLDGLVATAHEFLKPQAGVDPEAPGVLIQRLKGVERGYAVSVPPSVVPIPAGWRPTILLGKKTLILGSTPAAARAALALEGGAHGPPASDPLAQALRWAPDAMTFVNVNDTRQSLLPELLANLPALVELIGSRIPPNRGPRRIGGITPNTPGNRGLGLNIDADNIPEPEALRPFLFPSMLAFGVDEQGFQYVARESFPSFNPVAVAPVALALLLPAVQSARTAAQRSQSVNNLKQMALAMHNFHSVNDHFPPQAITGPGGKPLLSWRVAILPFLEQQGLFQEFKQDEPWDSPHNKALLERMPAVYAIPGVEAEPGMTFYRGFSGEHTLFDPKVKLGVGIASVTDGTSNTLGVVEARKAVPWTKPDADIEFDASAKPENAGALLPSLGGHFPGGFNGFLLDGSVRFIKMSISPVVLRALITRDGGEVVSADSF
jgi:hypothetical protein